MWQSVQNAAILFMQNDKGKMKNNACNSMTF